MESFRDYDDAVHYQTLMRRQGVETRIKSVYGRFVVYAMLPNKNPLPVGIIDASEALGTFDLGTRLVNRRPRRRRVKKDYWMSRAFKPSRRGKLHRYYGIPEDQDIPLKLLMRDYHKPGKLGEEVRAAVTAGRLSRARARKRHARRRHRNPASHFIGSSPVVHVGRRSYPFPGGRLLTGPGERRATIIMAKGAGRVRLGARVKMIDYRNDAKALRAYGRRGPFRHRFTHPARVLSSGGGRVVIESSSRIWERQ